MSKEKDTCFCKCHFDSESSSQVVEGRVLGCGTCAFTGGPEEWIIDPRFRSKEPTKTRPNPFTRHCLEDSPKLATTKEEDNG